MSGRNPEGGSTTYFDIASHIGSDVKELKNRITQFGTPQVDRNATMDHEEIMIVVTYNIHGCLGTDGVCNPYRVAETLQVTNADVVGLQEVRSGSHGLNEEGQARFLAEKLDMEFATGSKLIPKEGTFGNAILSRLPIEGTYNLDITVPGFRPRSCMLVTLRGSMGNILIANTHLGLSRRERKLQAKLIYDCLIKMVRSRDSLIFMGDFNDWGTVSQVHKTFEGNLKLATAGMLGFPLRSYPTYLPLLPLDRIYCGMGFLVTRSFILKNSISRKASDHYPVVAELRPAVPARVKDLHQTFALDSPTPSASLLKEANKYQLEMIKQTNTVTLVTWQKNDLVSGHLFRYRLS